MRVAYGKSDLTLSVCIQLHCERLLEATHRFDLLLDAGAVLSNAVLHLAFVIQRGLHGRNLRFQHHDFRLTRLLVHLEVRKILLRLRDFGRQRLKPLLKLHDLIFQFIDIRHSSIVLSPFSLGSCDRRLNSHIQFTFELILDGSHLVLVGLDSFLVLLFGLLVDVDLFLDLRAHLLVAVHFHDTRILQVINLFLQRAHPVLETLAQLCSQFFLLV